jgi:undecaprenyl-diphosphatase
MNAENASASGDRANQPAGSRVDAGTATESGPLGRVDPPKPAAAPPGTVPRPPIGPATMAIVVGMAGLIAVLVVLGFVAEAIRRQEVFTLDTVATPFLHGIQSARLDGLMNAFTTIGSSWVIPPLFVAALVLLGRTRRFGAAAFLSLAALGGVAIEWIMKLFFARPRPQLAWAHVQPDYSFPSGHTMNSTVFYLAVALILWSVFGRRIGLLAITIAAAIAIAVGISRIYLGYHYLTDVLGGILAGVAWLMVVGFAFRLRPKWWAWGQPAKAQEGTGPATGPPP